MTTGNDPLHPLETILRQCAAASPQPWYPSAYAQAAGVSRDSLDPYLDHLRLGGLVMLTEWVAGRGQGYALTPQGVEVLHNPRQLARLNDGVIPGRRPEMAAPLSRADADLSTWERGEAVRQSLFERGTPYVTYTLLAINIAVFVLDYLNLNAAMRLPADSSLRMLFRVSGEDLARGQWWRLLTACFVHGNLFHILMNMYALHGAGQMAEQIWGRWRYLALYLIAGLGGSCLAMLLLPEWGMVGASGALCGIIAAEGVWLLFNRNHLPRNLVSVWTRNLVINFILISVISLLPGVSWQGHLGGAAVGAVLALLLSYQRYGVAWQRGLALVGVVLVPVLCVGWLVHATTTTAWQERMSWGASSRDPDRRREEGVVRRRGQETRRDRKGEERKEEEPKPDPDANQRQTDADFDRFDKTLMPEMRRARQAAELLREGSVKRLLELEWKSRYARDVKAAMGEIGEARATFAAADEKLRDAHPFKIERFEKARQTALTFVAEQAKLFDLAERCLREGKAWTDKDEAALEEHRKRADKAYDEWNSFLSR